MWLDYANIRPNQIAWNFNELRGVNSAAVKCADEKMKMEDASLQAASLPS